MAGKADIWMPLYVNDYLGDTMHLTRDEHGAYLLLIMAYWKRGGPLPDDPASLAAIARATPEEWQRTLNVRCQPFFSINDGFWNHKRVDTELEKANRNIAQKRQAGIASANARTNGRCNSRSTDVPTATPTAQQRSDGVGIGVDITSLTVVKNPSNAERVGHLPIPPQLDTEAFRDAWRDWQAYRREIRHPLKPMSAKGQLRDFSALGVDKSIIQIQTSIKNGWQGLFETNGKANGKQSDRELRRARECPENLTL